MIHFLYGENSYERDQRLQDILTGVDAAEVFDGETLTVVDLPMIFMGQSLFSTTRTIVVKQASKSVAVWGKLEEYIDNIPEATTILFVETKPDKRTKTFKLLQRAATVETFDLPKNTQEAIRSAKKISESQGLNLAPMTLRFIVERTGYDPMDIHHALEKVALLGAVDQESLADILEDSSETKIFALFQDALARRPRSVHDTINKILASENPHQVFGFLTSQVFQLAAISIADPTRTVAKDFGVHPFVIEKLQQAARSIGRAELRTIVAMLVDTDTQLKTTTTDPWRIIETGLLKIATRT